MPTVNAIAATATGYPAGLDEMLVVIANILINANTELPELTNKNVTVVAPEKSVEEIDKMIQDHMAKAKGLSVVIIAGGGQNVEKELDQPRFKVDFEIQLFSSPILRSSSARTPLVLMLEIIRLLHGAEVSIAGYGWYERITSNAFAPLPDPDFTAYSMMFEREMQF
jgi:uncharacterized hydantoinase/oxoprolinase family protein